MNTRLSDYTGSRDNNFNLIRFIAAAAVLYSHSFPLYGWDEAEPLKRLGVGVDFGSLAVDIFFFTSGMLIAGSFYARSSLKTFTKARVFRIYPALIVAVLLTVFVLGPYFTKLSMAEYFTERDTWKYLERNATLVANVKFALPGVFTDLPYLGYMDRGVVNASLWTLPYEIKSYIILALFAWILNKIQQGKTRDILKPTYLVLGIIGVGLYLGNDVARFTDSQGIRLYTFFFLGACTYIWRDKVVFSGKLAGLTVLCLILATLYWKSAFHWVYILGLPYLILYLAYIPKGVIREFNKLGDYSYGIYIYAFPIQQAVLSLNRDISFEAYIAYSALGTIVMAIFSWHVVEKRCLKFSKRKSSSHKAHA